MNHVSVFIPTLNGGARFQQLLESLSHQTLQPQRILIIDSDSEDQTATVAKRFGCEVITINRAEFDHGATRQMGVKRLYDAEFIVFFTQDAIPADADTIQNLIRCFSNPRVGAAYGRQIPDAGAGLIGAHARLLNYPDRSTLKSVKDIPKFGLKTTFLSNSFAAYRRSALQAIGGFPENVILGEDMMTAAGMLLSGWKIAYCAEARVVHYHNYSFSREFKRYFDIGVTHARHPWLREQFGKIEGEGLRYLKSEMRFLLRKNCLLIPSALIRTVLKLSGFRLGIQERKIPRRLKTNLSMNAGFWVRQSDEQEGPVMAMPATNREHYLKSLSEARETNWKI